MAAVQQSTLKQKTMRVAAVASPPPPLLPPPPPSPPDRPPRLGSPFGRDRRGSWCGRGDGDGEEEPKRQFCCDRRGKRSSLALALSLALPPASRVRCLPAGDVVAHRAGGEGRAAVCSFFDFNPSKLKAKNWDKWASYSQVTVG